jgi:8-oxo-dGTP diphosphatase
MLSVCETCWQAKAVGGELQSSSESLEVGFFTIEEALQMVSWGNFRDRITKILDEREHPFYISF